MREMAGKSRGRGWRRWESSSEAVKLMRGIVGQAHQAGENGHPTV